MIDLPDMPFFLFGAGGRRKLIYRAGQLLDGLTGTTLHTWQARAQKIDASGYAVYLTTTDGVEIALEEDAQGVYLTQGGVRTALTEAPVALPTFAGHPHADRLRILHHEMLVNIVAGAPLPNYLVYRKPWYRDAAMVAMALARTSNIAVIRDWIQGLSEPFDRNNAGHREPDNLGQVLYLISLVSDHAHPLTPVILDIIAEFDRGGYICGITDFREHAVYQTCWLKLGLQALGLPDLFVVPAVEDTYATLCWWDDATRHGGKPERYHADCELYPYLTWAEAHFFGRPAPWQLAGSSYPLTWEAQASQADYDGMARISPAFTAAKLCMPHTWHAAEMFLYLIDETEHTNDRH
jgi:hypothetical protein